MRRDWDVIRKILLKAEKLPDNYSTINSSDFEADGIDNETAFYNINLLIQAGLVEGECNKTFAPASCVIQCLTWEGHEFLDSIKRDTIWNKIKETARKKSVDLTFETVKALAASLLIQIVKGG